MSVVIRKLMILGVICALCSPVKTVPADELDAVATKVAECKEKLARLKHEVESSKLDDNHRAAAKNALTALAAVVTSAEETLVKKPDSDGDKSAKVAKLSALISRGDVLLRVTESQIHPSNVLERVLHVQGQLTQFKELGACNGVGGPCASVEFDSARLRVGPEETVVPGGTAWFGGASAGPSVVPGKNTAVTVESAKARVDYFGSLPQGVALQGTATGLGEKPHVAYDRTFNVLMLDDRAIYRLKIPGPSVAVLARGIAEDRREKDHIDNPRVGVSIGANYLSYGKVPKQSLIAKDLMLTDRFLADIVFGDRSGWWSAGYKLKDGYVPQEPSRREDNVAVSFTFYHNDFAIDHEVIHLARPPALDIDFYPVSAEPAADGGGQPDYDEIARGRAFPEFEQNKRHVLDNLPYYVREKIVEQTLRYGETAALMRGLKAAGADLEQIARDIDASARPL